jgi:lipoate-protein ligase A
MAGCQQDESRTSISLSEILGDDLDVKAVTAALCRGFRETLGIILTEASLTKYETELTERLIEEKYSQSSWNLKYV